MSKYDEMRKDLKHSIIDLDADHYRLDEISNPHFKWGSNESPSRAFPWFRLRRGFAVPFLLAASLRRLCYFLPSSSLSFSSCSLM